MSKNFSVLSFLFSTKAACLSLILSWGAWTASHIAAERTDVVCCISPHPSITIESGVHGGDTAAMMKKVVDEMNKRITYDYDYDYN